MNDLFSLLRQDMKFHCRQIREWVILVLFFIIMIFLLPFALGPDPDLLRRLAPGFIWVAVLLMSLLAAEKLFVEDGQDGTLDLMLLSPLPLSVIVLSKMAAQSVVMLGALVIMIAPAALLLNMDVAIIPVLLLTLFLGVPLLVLLGGMIGAMTVMMNRNAALLTLLLIPFYIPVLIFSVAACDAVALGSSPVSPLLFLGALLALLATSAPFVIAATLRSGQG